MKHSNFAFYTDPFPLIYVVFLFHSFMGLHLNSVLRSWSHESENISLYTDVCNVMYQHTPGKRQYQIQNLKDFYRAKLISHRHTVKPGFCNTWFHTGKPFKFRPLKSHLILNIKLTVSVISSDPRIPGACPIYKGTLKSFV